MIVLGTKTESDTDLIKKKINDNLVLTMPEKDINLTMSFGIAKFDESMNMRTFIDTADQELYDAKEMKVRQHR